MIDASNNTETAMVVAVPNSHRARGLGIVHAVNGLRYILT